MYNGKDLEGFLKDLLVEVLKLAPIEAFLVVENKTAHMYGTVLIQFPSARDCELVKEKLEQRWYDERPLFAEFNPARDLDGATCMDERNCSRKHDCNYVHAMPLPRHVLDEVLTCS